MDEFENQQSTSENTNENYQNNADTNERNQNDNTDVNNNQTDQFIKSSELGNMFSDFKKTLLEEFKKNSSNTRNEEEKKPARSYEQIVEGIKKQSEDNIYTQLSNEYKNNCADYDKYISNEYYYNGLIDKNDAKSLNDAAVDSRRILYEYMSSVGLEETVTKAFEKFPPEEMEMPIVKALLIPIAKAIMYRANKDGNMKISQLFNKSNNSTGDSLSAIDNKMDDPNISREEMQALAEKRNDILFNRNRI